MTARPMAFALQGDAGAAGAGHAQRAAEGGADGRADGRDLVLGLEGLDAEALEAASWCSMSLAGVIG